MSEQIVQMEKTIYSNSINNVINNQFNQLIPKQTPTETTPDLNINEFFDQYNTLFFEIPPSGSDESHLGLASRSLEYLGVSIEDLQSEIDYLRQENVELKNQILQITGLNPGDIEEI
jgi:hypothetical protein